MLSITLVKPSAKRPQSDLVVIPCFQSEEKELLPTSFAEGVAAHYSLPKSAQRAAQLGDFKGKSGETCCLYGEEGGKHEPRILLLGLGERELLTVELLRRAAGNAIALCRTLSVATVSILFPLIEELSAEETLTGIVEGALFANYAFDAHLTKPKTSPIAALHLCGAAAQLQPQLKNLSTLFKAVYFAKDLVNRNADEITPAYLAECACNLAKTCKEIKTTVWGLKEIQRHKMGLLEAVGRGSTEEPQLLFVEYIGPGCASRSTKAEKKQAGKKDFATKGPILLVGKGVTFDTGGLNLKPTSHIETMRCDMSGAAAVLGTLYALAALQLPLHVIGVIPTAENAIDATSYKPGDVYRAYDGTTVEIGNTDAEGRLILADAMAYSVAKYKPEQMITIATLTGSAVMTFSDEVSAMMSDDDALAAALSTAGEATYERLWRLPLLEEYQEKLKSQIADTSNIGGREAGAITAALFLQRFVKGKTRFAHIDIAGPAFLDKPKRYLGAQATGVGVRLFIRYLSSLV